jgi:hypothetical protein
MCCSPKERLAELFTLAGLSSQAGSISKNIRTPAVRQIDNIDEKLMDQALKVYRDLSSRKYSMAPTK